MSNFKKIAVLFSCLSFILITISATAQKAVIAGKVIDKTTGESLIGVTIMATDAANAVKGAVTDYDGNYSFEVVPGIYTITVNYTSYQKQTITAFDAKINAANNLDVVMEEESNTIAEVVIVATQVRNTDASLVAIQRKAFAIQDGLSSQQITRTSVSNAADAMKQVTGAVVEGGKFIVMRGLGDRYSISQLNGITMPSTDPYRNSSSLDLIPAQMIENMITVKTFTPDLPGNFSGGLVNITTKSFPEKFTLNFGLSTSFNTLATGIDNFLGHGSDEGKYDYLGIDDGGRQIPELLKSAENRALLSQTAYLNARRPDEQYNGLRTLLNESSRQLSNVFVPTNKTTPVNHGFNFSVGNSLRRGKNMLGFTLGLNYSRDFAHYDDGIVNTFTNSGVALFEYQALTESKSVETPHLGGLFNVAYKFGNNHSVSANVIYNNDTDIIGRRQQGSFFGQLSTPDGVYFTNSMEFIRRQYTSYQLSGKHNFPGLNNTELQWSGSTNRSSQSEPDSRYFAYVRFQEDQDTIYAINDAEFRPPFHFFRDLQDASSEFKLDVTIPFLTGGNSGSSNAIKLGGLINQMTRTFSEYQFQHNRHGGVPSNIAFSTYEGDFESFFSYDNFGVVGEKRDVNGGLTRYDIGYHYINQINNKNFYDGKQTIGAAYMMGIYNVLPRLKLVAGARLESTDLFVESRDTSLAPSQLDLVDVLYSGNLIYSLTEKSNLRLAASRTLARPNMRELAPFEQFDTKNGFFNIGNPNLQRTLINNYDLRYEIYPNLGELIALSVFYKQFNNPILRTFSPTATIPELGYLNIDVANVYGVELELRKNLGFLGAKFLENFNVATNLALINSVYNIPANEIAASKNIDAAYDQTTRPFQGQAPYIANFILSYNNVEKGWESALAFNVAGRRLYNISLAAVPDVYEEAFPLLNYTLTKRFANHYQVSVSARNLLNPLNRKTQTFKGTEYIAESFRLGRTFGLSLSYFIR
jgi:TonB dependent receptor/CarboxypepD_reg-like domain/TonB-dependent Receptor Plug Domain